MRVVGSKNFDTLIRLYKCGKIEIILPNNAVGWMPLTQKPPVIERHIDGFYLVFNRDGEQYTNTGRSFRNDDNRCNNTVQDFFGI